MDRASAARADRVPPDAGDYATGRKRGLMSSSQIDEVAAELVGLGERIDDDDDDDDAAGRKRGLAPCPESRRQEVSDASLGTLRERGCGPDCGPAGNAAANAVVVSMGYSHS